MIEMPTPVLFFEGVADPTEMVGGVPRIRSSPEELDLEAD